jgi:parvulin-like peptidyl-prolyl isomerase
VVQRDHRGGDYHPAGGLRQGPASGSTRADAGGPRFGDAPRGHRRRHSYFTRCLRRLLEGTAARQTAYRRDRGREEPGPRSDDQHAAHRGAGREGRAAKRSRCRHAYCAAAHQELHAAYDAATDKTEYHASHILVPTKEKAEQLIKKLKGGAKFEDVAKAESTDNSKANGGDLGWFTTARMVKPFGDAVKSLKKGDITTEPVQTQYGWHIIKLVDTRDAPFDQFKPQLTNGIMQKKFQDYIEGLKKNAKIEKKLTT